MLGGLDMFLITGDHASPCCWERFSRYPQACSIRCGTPAGKDSPSWDLIMPLFLFIVGAAMPFSFGKRLADGQSKRQMYVRMIRRVLILWVLGMVAQGNLLDFDYSKLYLFFQHATGDCRRLSGRFAGADRTCRSSVSLP